MSLAEGERVVKFAELAPQDQQLLEYAAAELPYSYHPYGRGEGFSVGAAVLTVDGTFHANSNHEAKIQRTCAERSTLSKAHGAHDGNKCVAMAVIGQFGDGSPTEEVAYPCPSCRELIAEFANRSGVRGKFRLIMADTNMEKVVVTTIGVLLPHAYDYP